MFYINYLIVFFNHLHIKICVIYLKCDKIFHIYYNITTLSYLFSFGTYFQSSIFYFNPFYICVMEDISSPLCMIITLAGIYSLIGLVVFNNTLLKIYISCYCFSRNITNSSFIFISFYV